ncbi:hypothetical protein LTR37_002560 [Vermiconidia calcicola]|uniref:Uncharacterized protein n=1 Tax=Vermiconidia calcicola TaxID=1690605 RepID=A0ACC3NTQ8_9PEZI|nr:hypothetical protein LTR37_002560 [Vermiconidia calcicola]
MPTTDMNNDNAACNPDETDNLRSGRIANYVLNIANGDPSTTSGTTPAAHRPTKSTPLTEANLQSHTAQEGARCGNGRVDNGRESSFPPCHDPVMRAWFLDREDWLSYYLSTAQSVTGGKEE